MVKRKTDYRKFKDGEMEAEFAKYSAYHKYIIIWNALKAFAGAKSDIFEHELVKGKYAITGDVNVDTEHICDILWAQHKDGNDEEFDKLYNYCWKKLCPRLKENANFLRGL